MKRVRHMHTLNTYTKMPSSVMIEIENTPEFERQETCSKKLT